MYKDFFRMKIDAFSNQPLPGLFFTSRSHRDVWTCLVSEINRNEPYLLVTGEYGTGKTTLCLRLVRALRKNGKLPFFYVATPNYDYATILQRIAASLGLAVDQLKVSSMQDRIFQYFEKEQPHRGIILILDDVQDMGMATLANLRLLANFSCDGFFPFRLILFGHPSFRERLHSQVLQALNQRIRRRLHLDPLSPLETKEYIYFRLLKSGASGTPVFAEDAWVALNDYSRGVPRLINNVCDVCLFLAASQGVEVIDGGIVNDAVRYLKAEPQSPPEPRQTAKGLPPVRPVTQVPQVTVRIDEPARTVPEGRTPDPAPLAPTVAALAANQELQSEQRGRFPEEETGTFEASVADTAESKRQRSHFVWLVVILAVFLISMLLMILLDVKSVFKGLL